MLRAFLTDMVDALVRSAIPQAPSNKKSQASTSSTLRASWSQPVAESVHDAWLAALRSPDGRIDWPQKDVEGLKSTLARWKRPITVLSKSPVRLCFRLEEPVNDDAAMDNAPSVSPTEGNSAWRASYLLHPHDDRSLLLPIRDLWSGPKKRASLLKHLGADAREYVLSAIGQASGISPEIAASLKDAAPEGYSLDVQGAHSFLTHTSLALEQAGFGVMLPSWWTSKGAKLRPVIQSRVASPKLRSSSGLSLDTIVEFDWQVSLGGEPITYKDLLALARLKQVCNHPAHFLGDNSAIDGRSGKLARLTEMLEEILTVGDRALIFTQFREMGDILRAHLQDTLGREVLFLHGGVTRKARDRMIERFQDDAQAPPIFILSLKAGSTGLNLTAANHVFHYDRWWNPAVENQATDRAFRIGQHRNVLVHKFVCSGTLEEKIDAMIERKKEISDAVVGVGEAWLTELSNQELRDLFALRENALEG